MNEKTPHSTSVADPPAETVSVLEERATLEKRSVLTGRTRVTTTSHLTDDEVTAALVSESVIVSRVPVGRDLEPGADVPGPREEGDTTILPVFEEILIVQKRLRLVEEIHIKRVRTVDDVTIPVTRRTQTAEIVHEDADPGSTS